MWENGKMNIPSEVKPGIWGGVIGAAALAIVGFTWGGWMTSTTAEKAARDHGRAEVVAALVPICLDLSNADPKAPMVLKELEAASSYKRRDMLIEAGWATMPGSENANSDVAKACAESLAANF